MEAGRELPTSPMESPGSHGRTWDHEQMSGLGQGAGCEPVVGGRQPVNRLWEPSPETGGGGKKHGAHLGPWGI